MTRRTNSNQWSESLWIYERIIDGRYVWRCKLKCDKFSVKQLLCFIFSIRYSQLIEDSCPSVFINAGTHGKSQTG